jgi:hypothetical protein
MSCPYCFSKANSTESSQYLPQQNDSQFTVLDESFTHHKPNNIGNQPTQYTNYAQPVDKNAFDALRIRVYSLFNDYYSSLIFTKTEDKHKYSIYCAQLHCQLCVMRRYIILFVPFDRKPVGTQLPISELAWVNLQSRTLRSDFGLVPQPHSPKESPLSEIAIVVKERKIEKTIYSVPNLPNINVSLLPKTDTPKQSNTYDYPDEGTIALALETYYTTVSFEI